MSEMKVDLIGLGLGLSEGGSRADGTAESLIERAGRTCYQSSDKITPVSNQKFVQAIVKSGHHSVLEHSMATFRISGISRACTHQLVRHRLMAISQESQRYCDEKGMYERDYYVVPKAVRDVTTELMKNLLTEDDLEEFRLRGPNYVIASTVRDWYRDRVKETDDSYRVLQRIIQRAREKGLTKAKKNEDARFLLPNACCSEIVITANFREYRHIIDVRCERHAQWEIREVACEILLKLQKVAPDVFKDYWLEPLEDGTRALIQEPKEEKDNA